MTDQDQTPQKIAPKIALVTGASRGLGAAMAEALAPDYHVIAVARTTGALEELDDRIKARGGAATLAPMDITLPEAMGQLCQAVYDRWGGIDLWVHTAIHAAPLTPAAHLDQKDWEKSLATNTAATAMLIPMVGAILRPDGTAVFFDDADVAGKPFYAAYGATKAAQMTLARTWAAETATTGPRVHIAAPAPMPTATRARFHPGEDRAPLADIHAEAARILGEIGL